LPPARKQVAFAERRKEYSKVCRIAFLRIGKNMRAWNLSAKGVYLSSSNGTERSERCNGIVRRGYAAEEEMDVLMVPKGRVELPRRNPH
jgi:hypothetical protein